MDYTHLQKSVKVALGWDGSASGHDLDMAALALGKNNQLISRDHLVFYNQLSAFDGAMLLSYDNQTGAGSGDDEELFIQLALLPDFVEKIVIAVTFHKPDNRTFQHVINGFVRIVNDETKQELVRWELGKDFSSKAGTVAGELQRSQNGWRIALKADSPSGNLKSICQAYGLAAESDGFFSKSSIRLKMSPLQINKPPFS